MPYITARLEWDTTYGAYALYTPYNKNFVELLNKNIPWSKKKQLKDNSGQHKCWLIDEDVRVQVEGVLKLFFPHYVEVTRTDAEKLQSETERKQREETERILREAQASQQAQANSQSYTPPARRSSTPQSILIEEWFLALPWQAAKKAMIEASKILHPDLPENRSDTTKSTQLAILNSKWNEVEKLLKK